MFPQHHGYVIPYNPMKYLKTIPVRMAAFPLLLMMATLLAASCVGGTRPFEDGRNYQVILEVILEEIVTLYEVAYTGEPEADGLAKDYVIRPSSEENELTVIRARIINHAAPRAQIDVEARPPELRTDTGRYYSLNTYEARVPTDGFHSSKNAYVPFI